jgi:hypothetical protein
MVADISAARNASPNSIPDLPKMKSEHGGLRIVPTTKGHWAGYMRWVMLPRRCMLADITACDSFSDFLDF